MNINRVIIVGRITRSLELKTTTGATMVLNFSVATNKNWKDKDGNKKEDTQFHNVVAFGKTAEVIAQYFVKGQEIMVEGWLKTRSWDDKNGGSKRYATEIILEKFDFGAKPVGAENAQTQEQPAAAEEPTIQYPDEDINPEDIPF